MRVSFFLFIMMLIIFQAVGADEPVKFSVENSVVNSVEKSKLSITNLFTWQFLWTGSWANSFNTENQDFQAGSVFSGGTLIDLGEIIMDVPLLDLSFRLQGIDKRRFSDSEKNVFNPGFAVYYDGNSRLLHGALDEYGLPARIKNIWAKSLPYAEYRKPSIRDLKTDSSSNDPETYLYIGLPQWGDFSGYASAQIDSQFSPAFGGGLEYRPDKNSTLSYFLIEGFYTKKTLPPRDTQSWFSTDHPLPERGFQLFSLGTSLNYGTAGFAADLALSETFAWGRDYYLNAGLRLGNKPWKFSMAIDSVGNRYVGRDGHNVAGGFRIGGLLEKSWIRSGLFRLDSVLRSPAFTEPFNRGSFSVYYRPSSPKGRTVPAFRITKVSAAFARNSVDPHKTTDSFDTVLGFNIFALRMALTGNLDSITALNDENYSVFSFPFFDDFQSFKLSLDTSWTYKIFSLSIKTGYTARAAKDDILDFSFYTSLNMRKYGRLSFKIASTDFPAKWNYTISWRLGRFLF